MVAEIERKIIQKFKDKESFTQSTHYWKSNPLTDTGWVSKLCLKYLVHKIENYEEGKKAMFVKNKELKPK